MKFQKGHAKLGGRQKGSENKLTTDVREMILGALRAVGGVDYLKKQAEENPGAFMGLVKATVPRDVQVTGELTLSDLVRQAYHLPKQEAEQPSVQ